MERTLKVLVTNPVFRRFEHILTRNSNTTHKWYFAEGDAALTYASEAQVLVCSEVDESIIALATNLELIHVTGAGTENIPFEKLSPHIAVCNTSHHGQAIAEYVIMSALLLERRALQSDHDMRSGLWRNIHTDHEYLFGSLLRELTVGVIGLGEIGTHVAELFGQFKATVNAVRRTPSSPSSATVNEVRGMDELHWLLAKSDIIVVTVPLNEDTTGLINERAFSSMKPHAILINVARGPVIDEYALFDALDEQRIGGAAIDVWWQSSIEENHFAPSHLDFTKFPNVLLTPHHSGHVRETFEARAQDILAAVEALAAGNDLKNVVKPASNSLPA